MRINPAPIEAKPQRSIMKAIMMEPETAMVRHHRPGTSPQLDRRDWPSIRRTSLRYTGTDLRRFPKTHQRLLSRRAFAANSFTSAERARATGTTHFLQCASKGRPCQSMCHLPAFSTTMPLLARAAATPAPPSTRQLEPSCRRNWTSTARGLTTTISSMKEWCAKPQ